MRAWLPSLLILLLGGCSTAPVGSVLPPAPAAARRVPVPPWVAQVRRAVRAEDRLAALRLLRARDGLDVTVPERAWLLALLLPGWCLSQPVRWRALELPAGDLGDALRTLTAEEPERALERLRGRRGGLGGEWLALAAAHVHARVGDTDGAIAAATRALASRRDFVRQEAWLLRGRVLLGEGRLDEAARAAQEAAALDAADARPPRLEADVHRAAGRLDEVVLALLAALTIAPESRRYAHRLAEALREPVSADTWQRVDAGLVALGARHDKNPELVALRALGAEHNGREEAAIPLYRAALAGGATPVPLDRDLRRLLMRRGEYGAAVALLLQAVPPDVIADPRNRLRAHWSALREAAVAAPAASAGAAPRLALARALLGVGALEEALAVSADLPQPAARTLVARLRGQLAFERALRAWVEDGYRRAARKEDPPTWEVGLQVMQRLAATHLAADERVAFARPEQGVRELPLLGAWLDHGADTTNPVVAHFRRYGRFLMYGQRGDTPPEAVVLSLASLTQAQPIRTGGATYTHDVAVGYDRSMRAFVAARGGALGGACLPDGIWLDADTARRSEHELRAVLRTDPGFLPAVLRSGALTADTFDGPTALGDPGCTAGRLIARYLARAGDDVWGSFGTLRAHEFGHVADIRRHLPLWPKLPVTAALVVRHGFDFDSVQMELEYRAQLVACVEARDPDLALAEMLLALPVVDRAPEVHDGGYRDALGAMVRFIHGRPDLFPQIDRRRRVLTQLDRLDNEQIRRAARAALGRP